MALGVTVSSLSLKTVYRNVKKEGEELLFLLTYNSIVIGLNSEISA